MLISNLFSRKVFSIMLTVFVILDIVFILSICIFFYISLNLNSDNINSVIIENNREIKNSFNSFLSRRISLVKQDLFLIGKHSDIFLGKLNMKFNSLGEFYQNYNKNYENSCLINGAEIMKSLIKDSYNKISDKENPLFSYINDYLIAKKGNTQNMMKDLKEDEIFNKISFYEGIKDEYETNINNYIGYVCYMKSIFKSIFIKESVSQGKFISLNNIYLFMNNFVFQYLPNETNIDTIKSLSIYSDKIVCSHTYTSKCISDVIKTNLSYSINQKYNNINYVEYFHYFDEKYNFFSCLNLKDFVLDGISMENNFVCIVHNINYFLQRNFHFKNLTAMNIKNNITNLISVVYNYEKLLLIYSLDYDINEFKDVYNSYFIDYNEKLKKYNFIQNNNQIELFHLIYFELFKYKKVGSSEIDNLIEEYKEIKNKIIKAINEIKENFKISKNKNNIEKIIECEQSFLYSEYNISGIIDYERGSLETKTFAYLISPIIDKNVYYKSNTYTKINFTLYDPNYNDIEGNILGFNIILFQKSLHFWNMKIFKIILLKLLRWFIYFIIIILFISTLFNVLFTKYLDNIFKPISLLYDRLSLKIMPNKLTYNEQNEKPNPNNINENKKNLNIENNSERDINSEIISSTPEMDELIQLCKFLENITYMKRLMLSNEQMELDFELMNEMYNVLSNKIDMIKYGHFVSSFYFKKKKYNDCINSIKVN